MKNPEFAQVLIIMFQTREFRHPSPHHRYPLPLKDGERILQKATILFQVRNTFSHYLQQQTRPVLHTQELRLPQRLDILFQGIEKLQLLSLIIKQEVIRCKMLHVGMIVQFLPLTILCCMSVVPVSVRPILNWAKN